MKKVLVVWGNWGPYHYARFRAFHEYGKAHGLRVQGVELFPSSGYYEWKTDADHPAIHRLNLGHIETEFNPARLLVRLTPFLWKVRPSVIFVPSYWHWSLFTNLTGRLFGAKIVMMNESHAGTERARGLKRMLKKAIVRRFDAALVGGTPHVRHFSNLGLDESRIEVGYDAVDNQYFTENSLDVRVHADEWRERLRLPEHYFLSLGRMVKKKNLVLLLQAYALLRKRNPGLPHDLVLVGSGEESDSLRTLCRQLGLLTKDYTIPDRGGRPLVEETRLSEAGAKFRSRERKVAAIARQMPTVHFYGFRQIQENPIFYALASAFILPSSYEEWGLVVNEAMACGIPVLVSKEAGCAEDLVESGVNGFTFNPRSAGELATYMAKTADPAISAEMGKQGVARIRHWGCERFAAGAVEAAWTALGDEDETDEEDHAED